MKRLLVFVFAFIIVTGFSQSDQYVRGKKNFILTAEYGSLISNSKVIKSYDLVDGKSFGIGIGKKNSTFLPFSFRVQYNYQDVNLPTNGNSPLNISEHIMGLPIQFDFNLFSLKLEKSQDYECRKLYTGLEFSLIPEISFINNDLNFHRQFLIPLELGASFRVCKSGGHKSVMNKDFHLYVFTRFDLINRLNTYNENLPLFENTVGLRLQLTKHSVSTFTQWYK